MTIKLSILLSITIAVAACVKPKDYTFTSVKVSGVQPEYAVPVINTELKIDGLLQKGSKNRYVRTNTDGYLSLFLDEFDILVDAINFVNLPSSLLGATTSYKLTPAQITTFNSAAIGSTVSSSSTANVLYLSPYEIDELLFKAGDYNIYITNNYQADLTYTLTVLDAVNGTNMLSTSGSISAGSNDIKKLNVSNYLADFTRGNAGVFNELRIKLDVTLTKGLVGATTGMDISVSTDFENSSYKTIRGYFGSVGGVNQKVSIPLNIFDLNQGTINFVDPKLHVKFENQLGLPLEITNFSPFNVEKKDGSTINITGLTAPFALAPAPTINSSASTAFNLDKNNSNLAAVVSGKPSKINVGASLTSNPQGKTTVRNFVTDTSKIKLTGSLELPLWMSATGFGLRDTSSWDISSIETKNIEWGEIHLVFENSFPLELSVKLYPMVSSTGLIVDSLLANQAQPFIAAGNVDANGNVISKG